MKHIIYISTATRHLSENDLLELLKVSRQNNAERGLTGILLYAEGSFIQVLEGDDQPLYEVFHAIKHDYRHKNIIAMPEREILKRNFPEWTMGFKSVNANEMKKFEGFVDPKNRTFLQPFDADAVIVMLQTFRC
jgi:hypothetical protein